MACVSTTGLADPYGRLLIRTLADMRRQKDPDEIEALRRCMRAGEAGHAVARQVVRPGMTELDVYLAVSTACQRTAGRAAIVYGDFAAVLAEDPTGRAVRRPTASWSRATC